MLRVHSSFHKCLTTYFIRIMNALYNPSRLVRRRYIHFESIEGQFYNEVHRYRLVSTNGFAVNPDLFTKDQDYRITRFVRDPRDLVISGYFYHLRGAEPWFRFKQPTLKYWSPINGNIPKAMQPNISYAEYLNQLSKEEGLLAEIEFRRFHLESLRNWPENDKNIRIYRYEDILSNERAVFRDMFDFYEVTSVEKKLGVFLADRYSMNKVKKDRHIRDPRPEQWKAHFTPRVEALFEEKYGDILDAFSYR